MAVFPRRMVKIEKYIPRGGFRLSAVIDIIIS